ncbi:MAG: response regulator [Methanospirillum sp.]|uniref:response regulator n=1 Tax=Methanospirillum sp. TaxID=45200 RepID=UPI0023748030|nr:response regulator [Methanospirillum sp.]MDD1729408.1 response regulator [Methanospirillum sp.]
MIESASRILYVDDEPGFLSLCKTFLERSGGLIVETTRSGSEALKLLKTGRYDAIIADYQMPGMDGVELLIAVRSDPGISEIPFILFTARGKEEVVIRAINNGADFYLQKGGETGVRFSELTETVKAAIKRRHAGRAIHDMTGEREEAGGLPPGTSRIHEEHPESPDQQESERFPIHESAVTRVSPGHDIPDTRTSRPGKSDSEDELRCSRIIAKAPWGVHCYQINQDGTIIFVDANQAADLILGITTNDKRGRPLEEVFPGLAAEGIPSLFSEVAKTGKASCSLPVRFHENEKSQRFEIYAFQTSPGHISAFFGNTVPEGLPPGELLTPDKLYQSFIEASPDVIVITDIRGIVVYASPRAWKMFSLPTDMEVYGREMLSFIAPEDRHLAYECIAQHMRGEQAHPIMYRLLRADGSSFPAEIHSAPTHDKNGVVTGLIAIIRDNSERSAQHEALERANTKLNLLSSITRHDILNKVTALQLYCSLIADDEDPAENKAMLRKVEEMATIISDLVAFTGYYQNLGVNTAQWISPAEAVTRISQMIDTGTIRIENGFGKVKILADPLFEKVLYNLFDNAVRYGTTITTIKTGYQVTPDMLVLTVADDGMGVPKDLKEKIFLRNFGLGTGLGLFLSGEILNVTNLSIRERGIPGEGARFEILVPPDKYRIPE